MSLAGIERLRPMVAYSRLSLTELAYVLKKAEELATEIKGESSSGQGTGLQNQKAQEPIEGSTPSSPAKRNICLRR